MLWRLLEFKSKNKTFCSIITCYPCRPNVGFKECVFKAAERPIATWWRILFVPVLFVSDTSVLVWTFLSVVWPPSLTRCAKLFLFIVISCKEKCKRHPKIHKCRNRFFSPYNPHQTTPLILVTGKTSCSEPKITNTIYLPVCHRLQDEYLNLVLLLPERLSENLWPCAVFFSFFFLRSILLAAPENFFSETFLRVIDGAGSISLHSGRLTTSISASAHYLCTDSSRLICKTSVKCDESTLVHS